MDNYNPQKLEKKWQKYWENNKTNSCDLGDSKKPKFYNLAMFYYPSGAKIHIGHGYNYSGSDVFGRYKRLNGFNVLEPMGADAFGLPAENYAIKTRVHPARTTKENIDFGRGQLKELGLMYDWEKEINTSSPEYYKWTQWLFTILYKAGLAYRAKAPVNWCPSCKTVLANEQVITGKCERCETQVTQKNLKQWFFKITDYADRLLKDHSKLNWPKKTLLMQKNWISRKEWIDIDYKVKGTEKKVSVSTTRPDTNFGATFIVAAPEHPLLSKKENLIPLKYRQAVDKYIALSKKKTDEERIEEGKKKTGVFTGLYCINPLTKREMPLWVTDFVLMSVGTGAVVAVPGHDKRDFEFAQEFKLPVVRVVVGSDGDKSKITKKEQVQEQEGTMVNSDFLDGMNIHDATKKIMDYLEKRGWGKRTIRYRLRDWLISRQRYWGAPIPVIFCENCENRKLNYVLIHGFTGSSKRNFFPWLEKELKKQGHKVTNLNLPNPGKPSIKEQVDYVLKNTKINKDTVLLGHSLGGVVVMKLLEKINKKTAKVLLVDSFVKPEFTDHKRPNVKKSCDWKFDFEKIKKSADEIIILADSSFSVIPEKQSREMEGLLGAKLVLKNPKEGHFCNDVEPDVFEELKNSGESLVEEKDLPIKLPELKNFQPTSSGESPLARSKEFLNVKCPKCGSKAKRSTETMDTFVCSSWYFLRFISPKLKDKPFDKKIATKWLPVDQYCGGAEHATLHLLYARFITKVLKDQGYINF
ncbi:leucine--tRNA ligase, partial [Candidatus Falkowbacteria bacterium]|nr:leucine--tRNA ligase [Candidatus Falkowbacteria bacterium]